MCLLEVSLVGLRTPGGVLRGLGGWAQMLPEGSRAKLGLVRKEQRWKLSREEKVGEVLSGLDAGAESAASVTGNVGREAAEMSPVSGLDLGRTRWVDPLGGPWGGMPAGGRALGSHVEQRGWGL